MVVNQPIESVRPGQAYVAVYVHISLFVILMVRGRYDSEQLEQRCIKAGRVSAKATLFIPTITFFPSPQPSTAPQNLHKSTIHPASEHSLHPAKKNPFFEEHNS
jgi:hypothetical protein